MPPPPAPRVAPAVAPMVVAGASSGMDLFGGAPEEEAAYDYDSDPSPTAVAEKKKPTCHKTAYIIWDSRPRAGPLRRIYNDLKAKLQKAG